jgi:hypothetical protein
MHTVTPSPPSFLAIIHQRSTPLFSILASNLSIPSVLPLHHVSAVLAISRRRSIQVPPSM